MLRVRSNRAVRVLLYVWLLLVAFWSFLPSPTIPYAQETLHSSKTLLERQTLTVVDNGPMYFTNSSERKDNGYFIFDWNFSKRLTPDDQVELALKVSKDTEIILSDLRDHPETFRLEKGKLVQMPFFDPRLLDVEVSWVDDIRSCGGICLPWFGRDDKILLAHASHGGRNSLALRIVVDERGTIGIWPGSFVHHALTELARVRQQPEAADYDEVQLRKEAMQFLKNSVRPIIQFTVEGFPIRDGFWVDYVRGNLPSKTYHIREAMLVYLGPILRLALAPVTLVTALLSAISEVILLLLFEAGLTCAGIMLSAWLRAGRPRFWPWTRVFWMTRWMYGTKSSKGVWGPAGPVESTRAVRNEFAGGGTRRPKTARLDQGFDAV